MLFIYTYLYVLMIIVVWERLAMLVEKFVKLYNNISF